MGLGNRKTSWNSLSQRFSLNETGLHFQPRKVWKSWRNIWKTNEDPCSEEMTRPGWQLEGGLWSYRKLITDSVSALWTLWGSSDILQGTQVQWHCRWPWVIWEAAELCLDPWVPAATWLWNTPGNLQGSELFPVPLKWTLETQSLSSFLFCTLVEKNSSRF